MQAQVKGHAKTLAKDGIVIIEDYLDGGTCDELYNTITNLIEAEDIDILDKTENYGYSEKVNWDGAVADKRPAPDDGMIDTFNIDSQIPEVKDFKTDDMIQRIITKAASEHYSPDNTNTYWNRSVTTTRDFHADTYSGKFKSFVYLTDVPDRSYGPFSYIRGSHQPSIFKVKMSEWINEYIKNNPSTDALFYNEDDAVYCKAPKGTLIIANQTGYHKGHPQKEGKERMLMTTSYTPVK